MSLLKLFVGYNVAKHLLKTTRPQPVNIRLNIELPDGDEEDEEAESHEHSVDSPADLNCFYVDEDCEDGPRFFTPNGREVDKDGFPISSTDRAFQEYLHKKAKQRKHF